MGDFYLLVELHREGSAPAACAACLFYHWEATAGHMEMRYMSKTNYVLGISVAPTTCVKRFLTDGPADQFEGPAAGTARILEPKISALKFLVCTS